MICRMCGSSNVEGARFCNYCGSPMDINNEQNPLQGGVNLRKEADNQPNAGQQNSGNSNGNPYFNPNFNNQNQYPNNGPSYQSDFRPPNYPYFAQNTNMGQSPPPIKTYMTHSIVSVVISVLFLCCSNLIVVIPIGLGITAIVFAYKTESFLKIGRFDDATKSSKMAKKFFLGSIISILVFLVFYIISTVFLVVTLIGQIAGSVNQFMNPENSDQLKKWMDEIMKQVQEQQKQL